MNPPQKDLAHVPSSPAMEQGGQFCPRCSHNAWESKETLLGPKSSKTSSWKEKQQCHYPSEMLARVNYSAHVNNLDENLAIMAASVLQLLGVSTRAITESACSAPCWKPTGFIRRACSWVPYMVPHSATPITLDFFRAGYSSSWNSSKSYYCN